jgi:hypothetical protein
MKNMNFEYDGIMLILRRIKIRIRLTKKHSHDREVTSSTSRSGGFIEAVVLL